MARQFQIPGGYLNLSDSEREFQVSGAYLNEEATAASAALLAILDSHGSVLMRQVKKSSTDQSVVIRIVDSGDGTPETGVEHNTSGIDLWYRREGATKTSITEAALSALNDAHSDGGIEHIGDGYYRLDLPDAAVATGANGVMVGGTVTGMVVIGCYVHLTDYDPQDAVRLGLTALPNAAADGAGGLPISDAGGLDLDAKIGALTYGTANRVNVQVYGVETGAITAGAIAADAIGASELAADAVAEIADAVWDEATSGHTTSGTFGEQLKTDVDAILADTGTDGVVVASGSKTGYSLTATTGLGNQTADITGNLVGTVSTVTNLTNAPTSGDLTATMKASVNAEVLDVLNTDTFAEPGQGAPAATTTLVAKIGYLFKAFRNRSTQTSSEYALYADDGTTKDQEAAVSDNGTTFERGEMTTGA